MVNSADVPVVVLVEDNADNLLVVEILVTEDLGGQCFAVTSGAEALRLFQERPTLKPDIILLDLQMPYTDGFAVLQQLRDREQLAKTKFVAVTANVLPEHVAQARAAAFDGFIGKPLDRHRFPEQMRRLLRGEPVWEARGGTPGGW